MITWKRMPGFLYQSEWGREQESGETKRERERECVCERQCLAKSEG
jgi:hypothetical protein